MWLIYSATVLCAGIRSIFTKQNAVMRGSASLFNFCRAFIAFLLFGIIAVISGFNLHYPTIIYGGIYGLLFYGSCFCAVRAMGRGPLGITLSIVSFSLIIPCLYGIVFLKETINAFDIMGFVLIVASIFMMNKRNHHIKHQNEECAGVKGDHIVISTKFKKGWWIYVLGTVIFDGLHATIKTVHQTNYTGLYRYEFICVGMFVGSIAFALLMAKNRRIIKERGMVKARKCLLYGGVAGITNGIYNYLVLYMAGMESATALFPIVSVATIAIGLLSGLIIFKEKLNVWQVCGVISAAVAIFLIKI